MYPSLFDSFFRPPTILVVSEERLKQLREYRQELAKELEPQSLEEALTGE